MWRTFNHWWRLYTARHTSVYAELAPQTRMILRRNRRKYADFLRHLTVRLD